MLYVVLDSSAYGHVERPLRAEFAGVISTVFASRTETLVQRGQILAVIVVLVYPYQQQQQGYKQTLQDRKNTRTNQGRRRRGSRWTSESTESMSEQEMEYRAWKEYCRKYPHHRFW